MKKIILVLGLIAISLIGFCQKDKIKTKEIINVVKISDSASIDLDLQKKGQYFIDSLINHTNIKSLKEFMYKNSTAEKNDEFTEFYNFYLQTLYYQWTTKKNK